MENAGQKPVVSNIGGDPVDVSIGGGGTGLPESTINFDPKGPNETTTFPSLPGLLTIEPKTDGVEIEHNGGNIKIETRDGGISGQCEINL
jgi:hypothetical protein